MADPRADGVQGIAAEFVAGAQVALAERPAAEQLDLLGLRPSGEALHTPEAIAAEVVRTGKAGRPKGAKNLATRELKEWLLTLLGRTPQDWRIRWLMLEPEELARRLRCSVAEAFDRQDRIAQDLGKYFMAPMVPVDQDGNPLPFIQLNVGNQAVAGSDGKPPWLRSLEPAEDAIDVTPARAAPASEVAP